MTTGRTPAGWLAATVAVVVLSSVAACGSTSDDAEAEKTPSLNSTSSEPSDTDTEPAGVSIDVTISNGSVDPQGGRLAVAVGEPITLVVTSDMVDQVHVHSDPEVAIDVTPGESVERTFTIDRPGQVAVESHELGVTILQLVVDS